MGEPEPEPEPEGEDGSDATNPAGLTIELPVTQSELSQPRSVRTSDDRRSKKGSKKEGKKQSGTAG